MEERIDRFFLISERGSTLRTELIAGLVHLHAREHVCLHACMLELDKYHGCRQYTCTQCTTFVFTETEDTCTQVDFLANSYLLVLIPQMLSRGSEGGAVDGAHARSPASAHV